MDTVDAIWLSVGMLSLILSILFFDSYSRWLDRLDEVRRHRKAGMSPTPMTHPPGPPAAAPATVIGSVQQHKAVRRAHS